MAKLVLIDGNAILHRAYHALPPLTSRKGIQVNAIYGFVSMLLKVITDLKPQFIAVAFDREEPTFRRKEFVEYQANRKPTDKELSVQFGLAREVTRALHIPTYEKAGFEADDLIGTLSKRVLEDKEEITVDEVVIVTGDRDILQLVNDKVKVFLPVKGLSEGKVYKEADVVEKMGCRPDQIVDYKALVGDASDNYKGVPGIGPKTAVNLLAKYGSFENIYSHLDEIPEATRQKLIEGRGTGKLSYKLAKIVTDMDIDVDLAESGRWKIDSKEVLDLFSEYGFKTLTKRVRDAGKIITDENQMKLI